MERDFMGLFSLFGSGNSKKSSDAKELTVLESLVKESTELETLMKEIKSYVKKENNISKTFSNWIAALEAHKSSLHNISMSLDKNNANHIQTIKDTINVLNVLSKILHDLEMKFVSVKSKVPLTPADKKLLEDQINFVEDKLKILDALDTKDIRLISNDLKNAA